jgi:hypothetical protein
MIKANLELHLPPNLITDKIEANLPAAKEAVLKQIVADTEDYIPYKTGKLTESVGINLEDDSIYYDTAYAGYAFYPTYQGKPKVYNQSVHSKAQGYPYRASEEEHIEEWAKLFMNKLVEGINNGNQ